MQINGYRSSKVGPNVNLDEWAVITDDLDGKPLLRTPGRLVHVAMSSLAEKRVHSLQIWLTAQEEHCRLYRDARSNSRCMRRWTLRAVCGGEARHAKGPGKEEQLKRDWSTYKPWRREPFRPGEARWRLVDAREGLLERVENG